MEKKKKLLTRLEIKQMEAGNNTMETRWLKKKTGLERKHCDMQFS